MTSKKWKGLQSYGDTTTPIRDNLYNMVLRMLFFIYVLIGGFSLAL